jgi:L-ascorbate metabolism protein UlaG (beta-lactamase superfamily)
MKIRYLGHSCVEIIGQYHILIDPDFTREFEPGVEYILITHAHQDHIGRVVEVPDAHVVASEDVCNIAVEMGITRKRIKPVKSGEHVANIQILPGYSMVNDPLYTFFFTIFRRHLPEPGGTPLSFLVKDEANLLHIGDAHKTPLRVRPDILCLPWRTTPFRAERYKQTVISMAEQFTSPYILPVHYDLPNTEADTSELCDRLDVDILDGYGWYHFYQNRRVEEEEIS